MICSTEDSATRGWSRWGAAGLALVVAVVAVGLYARTLRFGFVWDDQALIEHNPLVRGEAPWSQLWRTHLFATTEAASEARFYRPLVVSSYRLDWRMFAGRPAGFHLTNVLLHALCCALTVLIALQLGASGWAALTSSLLFAGWSGHTEGVGWIAARPDLLLTLGGGVLILSILTLSVTRRGAPANHLSAPSVRPRELSPAAPIALIVLGTLGGAGAALSKEPGLLILAAMIPWSFVLLRRSTAPIRLAMTASLLLALVIALSLRVIALGGRWWSMTLGEGDLTTRLARIGMQWTLASGFDLRLLPELPTHAAERWACVAVAGVACAGLILLAARLRRRRPAEAALLGLVLLALIPVASARLPALRYLYLPLFLLTPCLASLLARATPPRHRTIVIVAAALIGSAWVAIGQLRLSAWLDDDRLFAIEAAQNPTSIDAQFFYGLRLLLRGEPQRAARAFETILTHHPSHRPSWLALTRAALASGQLNRAEQIIRHSLRGEPQTSPQFQLLGEVLLARQQYRDAVAAFEQALRLQPDSSEAVRGARAAAHALHEEAQSLRPPRRSAPSHSK